MPIKKKLKQTRKVRVYILYETKDADEYGFARCDYVVGVYAKRRVAEKERRLSVKSAKKHKLDYTYCIVPEEVK